MKMYFLSSNFKFSHLKSEKHASYPMSLCNSQGLKTKNKKISFAAKIYK